jgi:hypothetical protein
MAPLPKVSKERLLRLIDELKNNPNDKIRVLGEVGIVSISASGAPLASVAAIAGVKSVFGLSVAAQFFGWMPALFLTGLSLTLLIGFVSGLGLLGYALANMVRSGGVAEGHKAALLEKYRIQVKDIEAAHQSTSITDADRTHFIISLRELVNADAIPIASAFRMIEMVEAGRMPISQAIAMSKACMETKPPE